MLGFTVQYALNLNIVLQKKLNKLLPDELTQPWHAHYEVFYKMMKIAVSWFLALTWQLINGNPFN